MTAARKKLILGLNKTAVHGVPVQNYQIEFSAQKMVYYGCSYKYKLCTKA